LTALRFRSILSTEVKIISANRIRIARVVAISADVLQIAFFPLLAEGFASPLDDALDVVVCAILTWLVGWHFAFLPSFIAKVVPMADLIPTWTIAIFLATRQNPVQVGTTQVYVEPPPQLKSAAEKSRS